MVVGLLTIELHVPGSRSLKEKRMVLRRIKDRLKHYLNVTWVSRPIAEDRPSELELFGEFYNSETF